MLFQHCQGWLAYFALVIFRLVLDHVVNDYSKPVCGGDISLYPSCSGFHPPIISAQGILRSRPKGFYPFRKENCEPTLSADPQPSFFVSVS